MSFYNILLDLCIEKNIKPTTAVKEMGITGPAVNRWKNGSMPNDVTLMKIAKYFDVSIEYLKTGQEPETKKDQPVIDKSVEVKQQLIDYLDSLSDEKIAALLTIIQSDEK